MPDTFTPVTAAPATSLRDETFDLARLADYHLLAVAAPGRLRLAALDAMRHKVLVFEDLPLAGPAALPALAAGHDLLRQPGWGRVRVGLAGQAFTLLPSSLYRPGDEAAYLALHHPLAPSEQALAYLSLPPADLALLFAADQALARWLAATHGPAGRLLPQAAGLLAGLRQQPGTAPRSLFLSLADGELTAVVLGKHLEMCNVYAVSTAEDVAYYAILVMQELGLNPDQDQVTIWGELTGDSATFGLLSTYIRHLRFGSRPFGLHYTYRLNEVAEHRHFDLFGLAFCG